ncbi:MAG: SDR family oxidoreductase [Candidatus Sericytochromatia bacterium]
MKFVLVAGATGYLGKHLVHELKRQGHRVRALVRNREKLWKRGPYLEPAVGAEVDEIVVADLTRPESLYNACQQIEFIVSCVGANGPGSKDYEAIDYQGNYNLLQIAQQTTELKKFIYISRLNPHQPEEFSAKERFVKALQESPTTSCIIRPTGYFSELTTYLNMARRGSNYVLNQGESSLNPIHAADLAQICIKAMIAKEKELLAGGPQNLSQRQIAQLAFETLGKKARIQGVPAGLLPLIAGLTQLFSPQRAQHLKFIAQSTEKPKTAPPQGEHKLGDYFKEYIASPFFREG